MRRENFLNVAKPMRNITFYIYHFKFKKQKAPDNSGALLENINSTD